MTASTKSDVVGLITNSEHQQIRAGGSYRFIDVSVMVVGHRLFCQRYFFNEPSWYSAFLAGSFGEIKIDDTIISVVATIPTDLDTVNGPLNDAFRARFGDIVPRDALDQAIKVAASSR